MTICMIISHPPPKPKVVLNPNLKILLHPPVKPLILLKLKISPFSETLNSHETENICSNFSSDLYYQFPEMSMADNHDDPPENVITSKTHSNNHFTKEEQDYLRDAFHHIIEKGSKLPFQTENAKKTMRKSLIGRALLQKFEMHKISNKIHYLKRLERRKKK